MSSPACCAGIAGFLIACRLSGAGPGTGLNLEIMALTAAVVGGNSLGGGRGSVAKGIMGAIIVLVMTNGLIRLGYGTGTNQMVLGLMLAVGGDPRHPLAEESPQGAATRSMSRRSIIAWARRSRPCRAPARPTRSTTGWPRPSRSGLASSKGPRTSSSTRTITSIAAPAMARSFASSRRITGAREVFAHTGGFPLGLAFDRATAISSPASAPWASIRSLATAR